MTPITKAPHRVAFNPKDCARRIVELRKEYRISQECLADALGISWQHMGKLERGERVASIDLLIDIADFFRVTLDYLVLGKPMTDSSHDNQVRMLRIIGELTDIASKM